MASIFQSDIANYRDERLKVVSPNMVRLELALLSHLFTIGVKEWGMAGLVNPVMQIRKPKLPRGLDRRLLPGELDRILSAFPRRIDGKVGGVEEHSITRAFQRAVARARANYEKEWEEKGIKPDPAFLVDLTFHDLRHEATSRFFGKGLNPMQVAAITGHKTLQMLKRHTHLKAEDLALLLKQPPPSHRMD